MERINSPKNIAVGPRSNDLFLGVDCGQSYIRAVVGNGTGVVVGCGVSRPAYHVGDGRKTEELRRAVSDAVNQALSWSGRRSTNTRFRAACFGLSGGSGGVGPTIEGIVSSPQLKVVADTEIALLGGVEKKPGIVVIAGTGSAAFGKNVVGQVAYAGGWGHIFGDEGGAFGIVRRALRAALKQEEGWGPDTVLTNLLLKESAAENVNELMHRFYTGEFTRARIASLAPLVDNAASDNDGVAVSILESTVEHLQSLAITVYKRLFNGEQVVPIVPVGGVFRSVFVADKFCERFSTEKSISVIQPKFSPVIGALINAYQLADIRVCHSLRCSRKLREMPSLD